ncbi:MAG: butyrate kinase [Halanaerobium sp.]|nr:butyrate kinase [Halanaerobium sp.]
MDYTILVINPGSTSTKLALYTADREIFSQTIEHPEAELAQYKKITDQLEMRRDVILSFLEENGISLQDIDAVSGRGGMLKPIPGGTYLVNEKMRDDLKIGIDGEHASNLGGLLAHEVAEKAGCPAYIVDPVIVDELEPLARVSGMPELPRKSVFHALNQKAMARRAAEAMGKRVDETSFIVAHLGGGISVGAHQRGRVIDVNNALDGEGPFSPNRSGTVPVGGLLKMCFSGEYTQKELYSKIKGKGGVVAYLGTTDMREVEEMIEDGNEEAELIFKAMAVQVAKEIGSLAPVLKGDVDGIIITGGIAYSKHFVSLIKERVEFIAPVLVYPGEAEMAALAKGALLVLQGEETAQEYC